MTEIPIPFSTATIEALALAVVPYLPPELKGDSAYDVAVANGFVGTEPEWLESLQGPAGNAEVDIIHESIGDSELAFTSTTALYEIYTGISKTFVTTIANQMVYIDVNLPYTITKPSSGASNGTFRLYLDGTAQDAGGGKQWNGQLMGHSGGWQNATNIPTDAPHLKVHRWVTVPTVGTHTLRLQYAGTDITTIGTLRSRQFWQVWTMGQVGEVPEEPETVVLLNESLTTQPVVSSNVASREEFCESLNFTTTEANQAVTITASIPFVCYRSGGTAGVGGYRLYLDGTALSGNVWNGTLLGSQDSASVAAVSTNYPATLIINSTQTIATAGTHSIRLQYVGTNMVVIGKLQSRTYHIET